MAQVIAKYVGTVAGFKKYLAEELLPDAFDEMTFEARHQLFMNAIKINLGGN